MTRVFRWTTFKDDIVFPLSNGKVLKDWLKTIDFPFHNTMFAGEQEDVISYYRDASLLLMPSECEGFGMSITEAGVAGLPVVTTAYPGCEELVKDDVNGYAFDPDDYEQAAGYIVSILQDAEKWKTMSLNAQKMASRFEKEVIAERYSALFDALLRSGTKKDLSAALKKAGLALDEKRYGEVAASRVRFLEKQLMHRLQEAESLD